MTVRIPETLNFNFIYIAVEDDQGHVLFRQDLTDYQEILDIKFKSFTVPSKWIYWRNDGEWQNRIDTAIGA